jgi:hypothetical protein
VLRETGIIVVASTSRDEACSLLREVMDRDAPARGEFAGAPGVANRADALLEELSRFNVELTTMQRGLAKKNRKLPEQRVRLWNILSAIDAAHLEAVLPLKPSLQGTVQAPDFRDTWQGGRAQVIESTMIECPTGGLIPVSCIATPLMDAGGKAVGAAILVRDMTPIQRAQDLSIESKRVRTAKGIAVGIAPAMNNILAVISAPTELMTNDLPR